jgi:hypothetical protein
MEPIALAVLVGVAGYFCIQHFTDEEEMPFELISIWVRFVSSIFCRGGQPDGPSTYGHLVRNDPRY